MNIIVTGGAGFIGSHLVDRLISLNHKVIVIDNLSTGRLSNLKKNIKKIKFVKADLSKKSKWVLSFKKIDCVFHLAGLADIVPSIEKPNEYYEANVTSTLNVMEISKKYKIKKVLYSASSSCYGIPKLYPTKENSKISPEYPYALTKYLGEQIVLHWGKLYGIQTISLRLFNVYGLRSRTTGAYGAVFGVFLAQKISNRPITIVGTGNQTRDFTYVSDVVEAFIKAMNSKYNSLVLNIGSNKTYKIKYLVKLLNHKSVHIPKRPGEPSKTWADTTKAKKYLNWQPKISLEQGVKIMIDNIKLWKDAPVWTAVKIEKSTRNWFKYLG